MLARLTAVACALVLLAAVATAAFAEGRRRGTGSTTVTASTGPAAGVIAEIIERLDAHAVRDPDEDALLRGAVDGVFEELGDDYAAYYDQEQFAAFNQMLDGEFSGVGLEIQEQNDTLTIVRVLPDTPAERAGIEPGERIVTVDGEDVRDQPIDIVVGKVKGEAGTEVTIGLEGGSAGPREITLQRETIELPAFEARVLDDGSGYVELLQFTSDIGDKVRKAVDQLAADGAEGIVLDLRGNPGGLLPEAINIASIFIEDGPIVMVKERDSERETYTARGDALESIPLVVLVDEYSASASEIVAAAIQDAGRGRIIGEPTFGKGTVQTIQRLDAGGGIKFTTAEYFTRDGKSIEDTGVQPDQQVVDEASTPRDEALLEARETLSELVAAHR